MEEKKAEGKSETAEKKMPAMTRSMMEEACPSCGADQPPMPAVLPDPDWSTEKLIEALKDPHMLVRSNAIVLLSKREPSSVLGALIQAMKDEDNVVRSNAMVAIASFGPQASDRVIEALSDPDPEIRAGAAWVMGELKDPRAVELLEKLAQDEDPLARIQAKASLMAMGKGPKKKEDAID
ncbi:MAG: HEAT repeat domain-containing protein [Methanotrichaceae archaeon]|nr:HEAT repeat domain-containing protein [Methanotrichaceae archaeon]